MDESLYIGGLSCVETSLEALNIIYDNYYNTGSLDKKALSRTLKLLEKSEAMFKEVAEIKDKDLEKAEPLDEMPARIRRC